MLRPACRGFPGLDFLCPWPGRSDPSGRRRHRLHLLSPSPTGDSVASTQGTASGPVSFLEVFDTAAKVLRQCGWRCAASMAVLDISHPDIDEFITAKRTGGLDHFNLSVGVRDAFMHAVERGGTHRLVKPRTHRTTRRVDAAELLWRICENAHQCGDPGLLFLDTINRADPLPVQGRLEATNPTGRCRCCRTSRAALARSISPTSPPTATWTGTGSIKSRERRCASSTT
nr:hypothetical protein [Allosalinactinospora lopnorensis]